MSFASNEGTGASIHIEDNPFLAYGSGGSPKLGLFVIQPARISNPCAKHAYKVDKSIYIGRVRYGELQRARAVSYTKRMESHVLNNYVYAVP